MPYKDPEKKREYQRKWRKANPEKTREQSRRYRKAHPEKNREKVRRYSKAHPEKIREHDKKHYAANSEKINERHRRYNKAHPEKRREIDRKCRKAHPERMRLEYNKKREKLHKVIRAYTLQEWKNKLNATNGICQGYEHPPHFVGIDKLTMDHIIAIAKAPVGLVYTINDIQPLCLECNMRKSDKITEEIREDIQTQLYVSV